MPTDPLTGARYPSSTASPAVYQDIQNAVNDLSDLVGGKFSTKAARDTAFSNWVAQGNTMSDGLICRVAGFNQVYRSGAWHGVGTQVVKTTTADSSAYYASHAVMTLSVPDPGFSYALDIAGSVLMQTIGASVNLDCWAQVNGTGIDPKGDMVSSSSTLTNQLMRFSGAATNAIVGVSTVTFFVNLNSAPVGNGYQAYSTSAWNALRALVIPA